MLLRRVAAVSASCLLTVALASAAVSAPALAAPRGTIPVDDAKLALKAAVTAATKASAQGYAMGVELAPGVTLTITLDDVRHRARLGDPSNWLYLAAGVGQWLPIVDRNVVKGELALLGRPAASCVFTPQPKLTADALRQRLPSPAGDLTTLLASTISSAAKASNADGSTSYLLNASDAVSGAFVETVVIGGDGAVTSTQISHTFESMTFTSTSTYRYGPQTVTLPRASSCVTQAQLDAAHSAIVHFTALVKARATAVAALAAKLAGKAHRRAVTTADIRTAAGQVAAAHARDLIKVTTTSVARGVRLRAVNPKTGRAVAFTVRVSAGRAVVQAG